jgi:hypothetical protein
VNSLLDWAVILITVLYLTANYSEVKQGATALMLDIGIIEQGE